MYKLIIKPILFLFPPEKAHHITNTLLQLITSIPLVKNVFSSLFTYKKADLQKQVMGLTFDNPVGLAAGFDKDGKLAKPLSNLGFGFIEVGTVTPKAQAGNEQPRLFRLPKDNALINRMGFNNEGVIAMKTRLKKLKKGKIIIGGNIGKNKLTLNEEAVNDYTYCFNELFHVVDYFAVNVSSPNTPNLRELQGKEPLQELLNALQQINQAKEKPKPILLKIAPDLSNHQAEEIAEIIHNTKLDGVIISNTTISRKFLATSTNKIKAIGPGGLSGQPVKETSTLMISLFRELLGKQAVIIGVGGIYNAKTAIEKIQAGADLIQVYTGLVYEGPSLVKEICKGISETKSMAK